MNQIFGEVKMTNETINQLIEKCVQARVSDIPIIYIKTESSSLIEELIQEIFKKGELIEPKPVEHEKEKKKNGNIPYSNYYHDNVSERLNKSLPSYTSLKTKDSPFIYTIDIGHLEECELSSHAYAALQTHLNDYVKEYNSGNTIYQSSILILHSPEVYLPKSLRKYAQIIEPGYPKIDELKEMFKKNIKYDGSESKDYIDYVADTLATLALGLPCDEIDILIKRINNQLSDSLDIKKAAKIIADYKKQVMEGSLLEYCDTNGNIGGMDKYRDWLDKQKIVMEKYADYKKETGTEPPKGVLLFGIPGCGKSEAAKFTAKELKLPLLKLDMGQIMNKWVGESERQMRDAIATAEAMAPCVLWIDEIDKGFSGATSDNDSSFKRLFGYLLNWMQEKTCPCFIFATANNIGKLPKELFRSGRFDALYAVHLPTAQECIKIFKASMEKAEQIVTQEIKQGEYMEHNGILFNKDCWDDDIYMDLVNNKLASKSESEKVRIIIGSDIHNIVSIALRNYKGEREKSGLRNEEIRPIDKNKWRELLSDVITKEQLRFYGESSENLDGIAINYCRMLRKGFLPVSNNPLFTSDDYFPWLRNEGVKSYNKKMEELENRIYESEWEKAIADRLMVNSTNKELYNKSKENDVIRNILSGYKNKLEKKGPVIYSKERFSEREIYDQQVYEVLCKRINKVAIAVELYDSDEMLKL